MSIGKSQEIKDPYENVPHRGKMFNQNGKRYWYTFSSSAQVGDRFTEKKRAFAPHLWDPNTPLPAPYTSFNQNVLYGELSEPFVHPTLGGTPIRQQPMAVLGMYYDIEQDIRCIEVRDTPDGRIALWEDSFPLSGYEQQCLAFRSTSVEEYETFKSQVIKQRQAGEV